MSEKNLAALYKAYGSAENIQPVVFVDEFSNNYHPSRLLRKQSCDLQIGDSFCWANQRSYLCIGVEPNRYCGLLGCGGLDILCECTSHSNGNRIIGLPLCSKHSKPLVVFLFEQAARVVAMPLLKFSADGAECSFMLTA